MDSLVVQRLEQAEGDLLSAVLSNNGAALEQYFQDWSQLSIDIESAIVSSQLQDATVQLARTVTSRVYLLSGAMLSFQEEVDSLTAELEKGLNDLFASMSLNEQSTDSPCTSTPRLTSLPPYVKPAYAWLMKNLHNPYPPKHVKATVSRESGCNVKDIDNWFISVRRRIGWNRVRRVHFANKRQEILSAAAGFFGKTGGSQTLDSYLEMEFARIQNNAVNLYNDKFTGGRYSSRPESPNDGGDSDADGSTDGSAQSARRDVKGVGRELPTIAIKRSSPSFPGGPQMARKTKRHREDPEAHSCKASKKRRINATEGIPHTPSHVGTLLDDVPEAAVPSESIETQSRSKRRRISLGGTENCTQSSEVASTSRDQILSNPLHVEPLPSNLWLFDNAAFCSAFSAEQVSQDLSAPLEIELFDPSRLFADFNHVVAADDHAASHPDPLFHSASIANYGESSSHVKQSSTPATPEESPPSEPGLLNVADPTPIPPQDFDWLFSLFDEKTFNNAYAYDTHAFSLPFDFGLTAPC